MHCIIQGDTATGYRAVRLGVERHPIATITHAFIWRVPLIYSLWDLNWSDRPESGGKMIISYKTNNHWSGGAVWARAGRACAAALMQGRGRARSAIRARGYKEC
eukprot:6213363-Pleurochrysis_carterae.AAC.3